MKIEIQNEWFSLEQCKANPKKLYVFGDNTMRYGEGGQAQIRTAENSIGIATKLLPSMEENSFFDDSYEQYMIVADDIKNMLVKFKDGNYETLVLPADGFGTGLSKMPEKSPALFKWLHEILSEVLNIDYTPKTQHNKID